MKNSKHDLLERANDMILLCRNADQSADQTVMTLAGQHEQLMDIETHLTSIDARLVDTQKDMKRLKGFFDRMIDSCRSKFHRKFLSKILLCTRTKQHSVIIRPQRKSIELNNSRSNYVVDKEIDEAFCQIDYLIHSLKDKAYTINDQLVEQAVLLDQIHNHMIESSDNVEQQTIDIKKINSNERTINIMNLFSSFSFFK